VDAGGIVTTDGARLVARLARPFREFAAAESLGGFVLVGCSLVALAWANSPWGDSYFGLWSTPITIGPADHALTLSLLHWINDGVMAVFFLLVGLELKRELGTGELASPRRAALPIAAAIGGMALPALLFWVVNGSGPGGRGWGIPMATDIAFALGVLSLVGPRVPTGLKVFLTALAIVDDLGAVLVIALFYTTTIHSGPLAVAVALTVVLVGLERLRVGSLVPYLVLGAVLWVALHESGVHATVAGVLTALAIPSRTPLDTHAFSASARAIVDAFERGETGDGLVLTSADQQAALHQLETAAAQVTPPLLRLEHALHRPVALGVMPLFALANAGVRLDAFGDALASPVAWGVATGLLAGKTIGILTTAWLAVRAGLAERPAGVSWSAIHGSAWLGGIGFTMALFVTGLAFGDGPLAETAKAGILVASTIAAVVGYVVVRRAVWS
jgi:NhaA family Na+:H+ antiporter